MILAQNRITVLTLIVVALFTSCAPEGSEIMPSPDSHVLTPVAERVPTVGFDKVTTAKDGEYVTLSEHIDDKYLCLDISATQNGEGPKLSQLHAAWGIAVRGNHNLEGIREQTIPGFRVSYRAGGNSYEIDGYRISGLPARVE